MTAIHQAPSTDPVFRLPPDWVCTRAAAPLSEIHDWSLNLYGIPELWKQTAGSVNGKPLVVCVCDTGVDMGHQDLSGQVLDAEDFTGSMFGPDDRQGHGTWCTGMLVAEAGNDYGVTGIAHGARAIHAKVLGDSGAGSEQGIIAGMKWGHAAGATFFSLSLGGGRMSEAMRGLLREFTQDGKFIFCAAGNDSGELNYPAFWSDLCMPVGAADRDGNLTRFSSRGRGLLNGIVGPGVGMISTTPRNAGSFGESTGTSMATPWCCGVGMLAKAKHAEIGGATPLDNIDHMRLTLQARAGKAGEYPLINPRELLDQIIAVPPVEPPTPPPPGEVQQPIGSWMGFGLYAPSRAGDYLSFGETDEADHDALNKALGISS